LLLDAKRDADSCRLGSSQHLKRGNAGRMLLRIAREIRMTRLVDSHSAAIDGSCFDEITGAGNGAAENVDAGSEVPDAAGSKRAKDVLCGAGSTRGEGAGCMGCHRRWGNVAECWASCDPSVRPRGNCIKFGRCNLAYLSLDSEIVQGINRSIHVTKCCVHGLDSHTTVSCTLVTNPSLLLPHRPPRFHQLPPSR